MTRKRESFPAIFQTPRSAAAASPTPLSPLLLFSEAIEEHFSENDPHFCRANCSDDLLARMNNRELYIVSTPTLQHIHEPCRAEITWYRDALVTVMDGTSSLKPEIVARIALERLDSPE